MAEVEDSEELESSVKGKQAELIVIGKLLEKGFTVYTPLIDVGVDCLVDVGGGNYKEIQVKYREDNPVFLARKFAPRENFYIICYLRTMRGEDLWVLPSEVFHDMGAPAKTGNREYIRLSTGKAGSDSYEELRKYRDNFEILLKGATPEVKRAVQQATKRIEGTHLTSNDYKRETLLILSKAQGPLKAKEIVDKFYEAMSSRFSQADRKILKGGRQRWDETLRYVIYGFLKRGGYIKDTGKNQFVITDKGRQLLSKYYEPPAGRVEISVSGIRPGPS
jgi:hypothetical protein